MNAIIHAYEIHALNPAQILDGTLQKILVKGMYTFPVYGLNEDIIALLDSDDSFAGYVAVKSFSVKPAEELTEEEAHELGFASLEEANGYTKDTILITIVDVIPVIDGEECDCENCNCDGDCDDCRCENCECKDKAHQEQDNEEKAA